MILKKKAFEKIVGKRKNAGKQNFHLFPQCFYLLIFKNQHYSKLYFVICKCFQFCLVQIFCKELTLSQTIPGFYGSCKMGFWKHCGTGIFSISHNVFHPFQNKYQFLWYICCVICKYFEFGQVQNFAVWERVKSLEILDRQNFGLDQTQSICRWQNHSDSKIEICFGKSGKHSGKRRKFWKPAFSPFPTMFSKAFFFRGVVLC